MKRMIVHVVVTALVVTVWQIQHASSCVGGRYGRYENWPSKHDWEELFMLLTGKFGSGGWGWTQKDSYAYNSVGGYPYDGGSTSSLGGSGGFFSSSSGSSSPFFSSNRFKGTSSGSGSSVNNEKMKKALSDYFNGHKNHHISSVAGGGGIGQSFIDSPSPPTFSGPSLPAGPPYDPPSVGSWSGSSGPPESPFEWPPPSSPPVQSNYDQNFNRPSPTLGFNDNSNHNSVNINSGNKNLFHTDYDVLGNKKRRHGKRRWRNSQSSPEQVQTQIEEVSGHAGLPTKPHKPLKRVRPYRRRRYRKQRLQDRRGLTIRRKLNTSFGGYKIDYNRLRF